MAIDLSKYTPKQIAAIVELDHREQARESLIASCCFFDSKYIPSRTGFHSKMAAALEAVERGEIKQLIISTPPQHGKLIADETPVLTSNGWATHGELKQGDFVVGGDGSWTTVVAVSESGTADTEVRFNDGSVIQCHAKHEWKVRRNWTGRRDWKVLETKDLVRNWTGSTGSRGCRAAYSIDTVAVTGTESELKVNPYVLGAWLGDGTSSKGALTFHPKDQEPFAEFKKHYRVTSECIHAQTTCVTAYFDSLKQDLGLAGVLNNKHIPGKYLTASRRQRLELLAGLMDTDGYICHRVRRAVFSNFNKELAQDFATLVISLGWRATIAEFAPVKSSSGIQGKKTVYQVSFSPDEAIPCRIPRKKNVAFKVVRRLRSIASVGPCSPKRGKCIQVSNTDGIYLVGRNLIPTHNSRLAAQEFVTWFLGRNPLKRIVLSSYASGLAEKNGMICRNRVADPRFRALFGTGLSESRYRIGTAVRRIDEWYLENGIGGVKSVGVGSGITGFSADLCIVDDPVKGWEEAHSLTIRENVWNWFLSDLTTRKSEGAPVIFIMCMTGDTPVRMADGTERELRLIKPGDRVASFDGGKMKAATVAKQRSNGKDAVFQVKTVNGKVVRANDRHPFLVEDNGELKWIRLKNLNTDHKIVALKDNGASGLGKLALQTGALNQLSAVDIACHTTSKNYGKTDTDRRLSARLQEGMCVSSSDTELQAQTTTPCSKLRVEGAQSAINCPEQMYEHIGTENCALTIATTPTKLEHCYATIATLQSDMPRLNKLHLPLLDTCDFTSEKIESITPAGYEEVFDVQVEETENFIANGLVVHNTRWHMDDIVGRLLDPKRQEELRMAGGDPNWTVLNLTGIAKGSDPLHRKPGEALFPEMKSAEFIRSQMAILGPYLASALYDGNPVAIGGNYIDPADLIVKSSDEVPIGMSWCRAWDLAATEQEDILKNDPDYTAGIQGALDSYGNLWLRRMIRGQWKWPKTREAIRSTTASEYAVPVGVEAVGGFKTAFDNLAEVVPPTTTLREYGVDKNKLTRALPWTALAARKKVFLVAGEWVADFKSEAQAFPGGAHDDQIDCVSLVYEMLEEMRGYGGVALVERTERERTVDGQDFFSESEGDRGGGRRLVL